MAGDRIARTLGALALLLGVGAGSGGACASADPSAGTRWGVVALPGGGSLSVEIADTPERIQRGYMFRDRVPEGEGMVFFLGKPGIHPFWMKNCRTALDILWLDDSWRIVHIAPTVPPCREDPCPSYTPMQVSLYALEVGPGEAARLGLKVGDRVAFIPPPEPGR